MKKTLIVLAVLAGVVLLTRPAKATAPNHTAFGVDSNPNPQVGAAYDQPAAGDSFQTGYAPVFESGYSPALVAFDPWLDGTRIVTNYGVSGAPIQYPTMREFYSSPYWNNGGSWLNNAWDF